MNVNICIGIISYLPDNKEAREVRIKRLNNLLKTINATFKLPVLIIAQNWKDNEIVFPANQIHQVNTYDKLGITLARETLRQVFIDETEYSHIICLDDDFEISDNPKLAQIYKYVIKSNPDMFIEYGNFLMNLAVFPRDIYKDNPLDTEIDAEKGTGFEDWIYMTNIQRKYPNRYRKVKDYGLSVHKRSELVEDKYSTWITDKTDKSELDRLSRDIIYEV